MGRIGLAAIVSASMFSGGCAAIVGSFAYVGVASAAAGYAFNTVRDHKEKGKEIKAATQELGDIAGKFYKQDGQCVEQYQVRGTTLINRFACPENATLADSDLWVDTVCTTEKEGLVCKDTRNMNSENLMYWLKEFLVARAAYKNSLTK